MLAAAILGRTFTSCHNVFRRKFIHVSDFHVYRFFRPRYGSASWSAAGEVSGVQRRRVVTHVRRRKKRPAPALSSVREAGRRQVSQWPASMARNEHPRPLREIWRCVLRLEEDSAKTCELSLSIPCKKIVAHVWSRVQRELNLSVLNGMERPSATATWDITVRPEEDIAKTCELSLVYRQLGDDEYHNVWLNGMERPSATAMGDITVRPQEGSAKTW